MDSALIPSLQNHTLAFFLQDLGSPGGTEKVITVWCNHFTQSGYQVELVSEPSSQIFFPLQPMVKQSFMNLDAEKSIKANPLILLKRLLLCKRWLAKKNNYFFIINKSVYLLPFLILKRLGLLGSGNRVIYYSHNSASMFEARFSKRILQFIYKTADMVLCLYHDFNYQAAWPEYAPKVLPNPCPFSLSASHLTKPVKKALYVGRFSYEKGLEIILHAWLQLKNSQQLHDWKLVLLGDGPMKLKLQSDIIEKNLSDCVELVPSTTEVQSFYQDAGLFLMASIYEGMPLVILEAKEAGLPVVSTLNDGAQFLINDGVDGTLVKDRSPASYAQALEKYFSSEDLRVQHGIASKKSAAEFSLVRITALWINYLLSIK